MSRKGARDGSAEVRRRIAATAATAAIAVSGSAAGAASASARPKSPPRPGPARALQIGAARGTADSDLEVSRNQDLADHRHLLAGILATELGRPDPEEIERELAGIEAEMGATYARGERPRLPGGLPAELGRRIGVGAGDVADAFEAMARHARDRRRNPAR